MVATIEGLNHTIDEKSFIHAMQSVNPWYGVAKNHSCGLSTLYCNNAKSFTKSLSPLTQS